MTLLTPQPAVLIDDTIGFTRYLLTYEGGYNHPYKLSIYEHGVFKRSMRYSSIEDASWFLEDDNNG